jgi:uncharacterized protein (TIGR02186 family)
MRFLAAALLLFALVLPAQAERLVTMVSRDEVAITSSFSGETLTLFGNIEPEAGSTQKYVEGPYHIIVVVTGPWQDRVARLSQPVFGIWMNTQQVLFKAFPSYYHVLSSAVLTDITSEATLDELDILPADQAALAAQPGKGDPKVLGTELIRLMTEQGHVGVNPTGVVFRSDTFYAAQVSLPSDIPTGPFLAHTYLFKNGALIAERSEGFTVRKIGFERFLGQASTGQPLLYGLVCVALALFTGWLGGVVFRR